MKTGKQVRALAAALSVVALAAAVHGCGGGGSGEGISLSEKWQRFEDGTPTLGMTGEQVSEAWRSAARTSTHRVILAGPVSTARDPGSVTFPAETFPDFPVDADACSAGECDLDPPPDSTWAFAPVLEHDGVPLAEFRSRFTRTETLEAESGTEREVRNLFDSLTYGGWLDHTHFNVTVTRWCRIGSPGCAEPDETDDFDLLYAGGSVLGFMAGSYSGTAPAGAGSATWTGVMVGMEDLAEASLQRERPDVFLGDARIVIGNLAAPDVDVMFSDIHNVTEGTRRPDMGWHDLPLEDGLFGMVSPESGGERYDYLVGMFTGPGHEEAGGEFRRDGIVGAFGARRR